MPTGCWCLKPIIALLLDNTITVERRWSVTSGASARSRRTSTPSYHFFPPSLSLHELALVKIIPAPRSHSSTSSEHNGSLERRRRTRKVRLSANLFTFAKFLFHGSLVRSLITYVPAFAASRWWICELPRGIGWITSLSNPANDNPLTAYCRSPWAIDIWHFWRCCDWDYARRSRAASRLPKKGPWNEFASSALLAIDLNFSCESRLVRTLHFFRPLFFSLRRRNNRFCDDLAGIRGQCATRIV